MKTTVSLAILLAIVVAVAMGCKAARESSSEGQTARSPHTPAGEPAPSLEPASDLPSGAIKASGNKNARVLLKAYVPGRMGGSAIAMPYDMTLSMVAQLQKEYPDQVRLEVYAIDRPEGRKRMEQDQVQRPSIVLIIQTRKAGQKTRRQVFSMVEETPYHPRIVAEAIRRAMRTVKGS